jgi:hypothetical protein
VAQIRLTASAGEGEPVEITVELPDAWKDDATARRIALGLAADAFAELVRERADELGDLTGE